MTMIGKTVSIALGLGLSLALTAWPADAQPGGGQGQPQQRGQQQQQQQPAPEPDFSEKKLDAFAEAAVEVNDVMLEWREKMQQAEDQSAQQEMLQKANEEIAAIVEETPNITFEEYQEIAQVAGQNQEFAKKMRTRVEEKMQNQEGGQQDGQQ